MPTSRKKPTTTSKTASTKNGARSTYPRKPTARKSTPARSSRKRSSQSTPLLPGGLSPERKIDILGVAVALVGLLTLISFFSSGQSLVGGKWITALNNTFGWGTYLVPIALLGLGSWLVARNVDRLPRLSVERITGIILLFMNLVVIFQILTGANGNGGGVLGKYLLAVLVNLLGVIGAYILVVAWLLVALIMSLDITIQELFAWAGPLVTKVKVRLEQRSSQKTGSGYPINQASSETSPDDYLPIHRGSQLPVEEESRERVSLKSSPVNPAMVPWALPKINEIL